MYFFYQLINKFLLDVVYIPWSPLVDSDLLGVKLLGFLSVFIPLKQTDM